MQQGGKFVIVLKQPVPVLRSCNASGAAVTAKHTIIKTQVHCIIFGQLPSCTTSRSSVHVSIQHLTYTSYKEQSGDLAAGEVLFAEVGPGQQDIIIKDVGLEVAHPHHLIHPRGQQPALLLKALRN